LLVATGTPRKRYFRAHEPSKNHVTFFYGIVPSDILTVHEVKTEFPAMEELACVRCMSSKFRNPNLVFSFNVCGHTMCANCIEVAFMKGKHRIVYGVCVDCAKRLPSIVPIYYISRIPLVY